MPETGARAAVPRFVPPLLSRVETDWIIATSRYRTRDQIARRLGAAADHVRVVTRYWWPPGPEHLHAFAGELLRWGAELPAGEWIYWVHPQADAPLTMDELEQMIGLAAAPEILETDQLNDGQPLSLIHI